MPTFTYKAKDRKGDPITGSLEADSRMAVSTRLQAMGYYPINIMQSEGGSNGAGKALRRSGRIRSWELANFYRQMSDLIGAGVPLVKALGIVKGQTPNAKLTDILSQVSSDVQGGDTFAVALEKHPKLFSKLTVALVRAGEAGSLLDQTLSRIADFAESQDELKSKIKSAMAYPVIMIFVGITAVAVLMTFVMPKVMTIFTELQQTLPTPTLILMTVSGFLQAWWWAIVLGIAIGLFVFRRWVKTESGAQIYHTLLLKIPKLGDLILKREIAGFTRTFGSLLGNGVPILNALAIAGEVLTIRPIRDEIAKVPEGITQGAGIAPTLRGSALFPPVVVNMVAIGEETGHLPEVLLRVADSYEMQVDRAVKMLTSIIEPVIILVMGLVVGAIVIAMLLPIFSLDPTQGMGQ